MKAKTIVVLGLFLVLLPLNLLAQGNYYYYYKGHKVYLQLDKKHLNINVKPDFQVSTIASLNIIATELDILSCNPGESPTRMSNIEFQTDPSDIEFLEKINSLKTNSGITNVSLYFKRTASTSIGTSNIFYVKLKNSNDVELLIAKALAKNVKVENSNKFMPLWYKLSCNTNSVGTSLELSNYFYETGLFADVDPAFMFDFKSSSTFDSPCSNDTDFNQLWAINNETNPNIDMNICQAWQITEGGGIKVAVVDTGIQKDHIDLSSNISPNSFDTCLGSGSSPSQLYFDHATLVAGTIAAIKNNNLQVVGVAPQSKLIDISNKLAGNADIAEQLANGINWGWQNGADIINNSWGDKGGAYYSILHSALLEESIINAMTLGRNGLGSIVTFGSGNWSILDYPGNFHPDIMCVGAIDATGARSIYNSDFNSSAYGTNLDVVAPGSYILTTTNGDDTDVVSGTSFSSPYVAGVAALILSVNSCLSNKQVRDIIERTSQKVGNYTYSITPNRPNGTWNNEMGYGLVDAYAAVQLAQQMYSPTLDLMVKDGTDDFGLEPNNTTPYMWASTDIWVRQLADGIEEHENPEYSATVPNYAYVRITNKSCVASTGNDLLKFYWAKAGTSLQWPETWDGDHYFPIPNDSAKLGAPAAPMPSTFIPVLQPGQETILQIPFLVPNPNDYSFAGADAWHFCLLARIESSLDPPVETDNLYTNVQNNNNIAWKNVTIVDLVQNLTDSNSTAIGGAIAVGNPFNEPRTFFLEMVKEDLETGKNIYDEAEVSIKMDQTLYNAWERGGKEAQKLEATLDEKIKIVKGNNVILNNISFNPKEMGTLNLNFNFLTKELTDKSRFVYHVIQKDAATGKIIGGETYIVKKQTRPAFFANAGGDKEIDKNQPITISAAQINEAGIYNWYDMNGNLIYQGKDLTVSSDITKKYKLEVIATADGFKDYDEIEVKLKPSIIESLAPNPSSNNVTIIYKANGVSSAYLMVLGYYTGDSSTTNNYILNTENTETTIDISNYQNGFYTIALVCDGHIVDAKTLIKN